MTDLPLSADDVVTLVAVALLVAHAGALVWFFRGRGVRPVLWLNLVVSGGVVVYWLPGLAQLFDYVDAVWAFVAFEFAVFAMALAAVFGGGVPRAASWAAFAAHAILIAAALVFFLTFKMTRLF